MRHTMVLGTKSLLVKFVSCLFAAVAVLTTGTSQVYFGEDINTTPPGQNAVPRGPRVNADAAFNSFISTASAHGVENFESFSPFQQSTPFTLNLNFPAASVTGTMSVSHTGGSVPGISEISDPNGNHYGAYPSSGTKGLITWGTNVSVQLSAPVLGFGFYGTDVETFAPCVRVYFTDGTSSDFTVPVTTYPSSSTAISGNIFFWGYRTLNLPITQVDIFYTPGTDDGIIVDDFTVLVPEPATASVLGAGLLSLCVRRRMRRKSA